MPYTDIAIFALTPEFAMGAIAGYALHELGEEVIELKKSLLRIWVSRKTGIDVTDGDSRDGD